MGRRNWKVLTEPLEKVARVHGANCQVEKYLYIS